MDLHPGPEERSFTGGGVESDSILRALQENEDWYQDLVEHSQDLLCIHDLAGRLLMVNPGLASVLGYGIEELLQIPMREVIAPEFRPQFDEYLRNIERTGEASGSMVVMTRSGERRIWHYRNTLRTEGVESPIVRGIAHDVTEQKAIEKRLREAGESLLDKVRESERTIRALKLFRTLVDQSNDALKVLDPETLRFLDFNEKACSELGYTREELLSLGVFDIDPAVTEASAARVKEELRKTGFIVMETLHRRKDGSTFPVEVSMRRVQLEQDYIVAIARDLTERKQAEARLQASENRYRALHERAPVGICRVETISHRFLEVNPTFCEIVGRTEQDMLERNVENITHPDDLGKSLGKLRQLAAGELRHYSIEKRYMRPDSSVRWVEAEIVAMWPEEARPTWHMAIVQDITERRLAEEALRTSERRQHKIAEQLEADRARLIEAQAVAKVGSWETELPNLEITWSEQTHRIFETDPSHFHPRRPDFVELIHPEDRANVEAAFQSSLAKGAASNVEYRIVMADGRVKVLEEQWRVFYDEQGRPIRLMGTCRDVTEQKGAEEALRRSEENYRLFVSQSSEGIFREELDTPASIELPEDELVDRILYDAHIAECNDALAAMYGLTRGGRAAR
jgi:PAS domain S-box-containing protein